MIHLNSSSKVIGLSATNQLTSQASDLTAESLIGCIQKCFVLKANPRGLIVEFEDGQKGFVHVSTNSYAVKYAPESVACLNARICLSIQLYPCGFILFAQGYLLHFLATLPCREMIETYCIIFFLRMIGKNLPRYRAICSWVWSWCCFYRFELWFSNKVIE